MKDVKLEVFKAWEFSHQETTKEWLFRLEKPQDYQRKLSEVVCNILPIAKRWKELIKILHKRIMEYPIAMRYHETLRRNKTST